MMEDPRGLFVVECIMNDGTVFTSREALPWNRAVEILQGLTGQARQTGRIIRVVMA